MTNKQIKSQKMVEKAVGSFTVAFDQVVKANSLLEVSVQEDKSVMEENDRKISELQAANEAIANTVAEKELEMNKNNELATRLRMFAN